MDSEWCGFFSLEKPDSSDEKYSTGFHWHISGPNIRDYHLMLDEQSEQIFAITDAVAERARKIGGTTLRSLGQAKAKSRIQDNDAEYVGPLDMLAELRDDNKNLTANMRELHEVTDELNDVSTTSLLEEWIDQAEERAWFLGQTVGK